MKSGCNQPSSFRGEVVWTDDGRTDGRTDDGRTTEPAYTISSPGAFGSGELKIHASMSMYCKLIYKQQIQYQIVKRPSLQGHLVVGAVVVVRG